MTTPPPPKLKDVRLIRFGQQPGRRRPAAEAPPAPPPEPEAQPPVSEVVRPQPGIFPKREAVPRRTRAEPPPRPAETAGTTDSVRIRIVVPDAPPKQDPPPPTAPLATRPGLDDASFFPRDEAPPHVPRLAGPARPSRRRGLLFGTAAFLGLAALAYGGWTLLMPPDPASRAMGRLVIEPSRQIVQHRDGGYVARLLVAEGDRVAAGDRLIALDPSRLASQAGLLRAQTTSLGALVARLRAEQAGRPDLTVGAEPGLVAAMTEQRDLLRERRATLDGQLATLQQRSRQLREQIGGMAAQGQARTRQIQALYLEMDGLGAGSSQRSRVLNLERGIARLEGERADHTTAVAQLEQTISEAELQALQLRRDFTEQVAARLREAEPGLAAAQERLAAFEDQLSRLDVRAPIAGIVTGLTVQAPGTAVAPGQELLRITTGPDRFFVETELRGRDVERLAAGGVARIHVAGLPPPPVTARLEQVATERTVDPVTALPVFRTRLAFDAEAAARLAATRLVPGMPVEVRIGAP
ncbi:HlyD family type I secretion periplasmic adaptor subunit [Roseococcus sp.]|uniref:HlyD family type I secretion periplasmic adaptor subunit n=1 Tax=Roseococcus sp. TaxID=2109646 RepID=UPI003BA8D4D1